MEKLSLDLAQTVIIGRFNPYIVTPSWLVDQNVCAAGNGDFPSLEEQYDDSEAFNLGGYEWEVSFEKLAVSAAIVGRDCGSMAGRVLAELPHTPVDAVGNNFIFVCDAKIWGERPGPRLGAAGADPQPAESRWIGLYRHPNDLSVEVDLTVVPGQIAVLRLNYDRRVTTEAEARVATDQFGSDYLKAGELIRQLFQIGVP